MARKPRETSGTGIYHVMLRGVSKQDIFGDDEDFIFFRRTLARLVCPVDEVTRGAMVPRCIFYAYCMMPNHVHLLIRETLEPLSVVIKRLTVIYAHYYNNRYERVGHLFQDRFKSEPVNDEGYFYTLMQFIHQNPVAAGISDTIADYPWSSWGEYSSYGNGIKGVCSVQHVLNRMSFDALGKLVNTMLPASVSKVECEVEMGFRSDDEVRHFLDENFGLSMPEELQHYDKPRRNEILARTKSFGASQRQLARLTGIGISIVKRA